MIDKEKLTIPIRSDKLFTLSTLYDANEELIGAKLEKPDTKEYKDKLALAVSYWKAVSAVIPDWGRVKEGALKAPALRQEKINTHGVVLRALGGSAGADRSLPKRVGRQIEAFRELDWRKSVGNKVNPNGKTSA